MSSKKFYKSRLFWQVFAPLVVLLWAIIGITIGYAVNSEKQLCYDMLEAQLENVNATIIEAHESGTDIAAMLVFINNYRDHTSVNDLRVTVYSEQDEVIAHIGEIILIEDAYRQMIPELLVAESEGVATNVRPSLTDSRTSIFNAMASEDGKIRTIASMIYDPSVIKVLTATPITWLFVFILAIVGTGISFLIARNMERAVSALHKFANDVATGQNIDLNSMKFPNDSLGNVSREIVRLYRDKDEANRRVVREQEIALRAEEEKADIKRQLANNLNHEIKTPVGIIKGYIDTILSEPDMPKERRENFLHKVQDHAERLSQMLKDISTIMRLEDGADQINAIDFNLYELVHELETDLTNSGLSNNFKFEWLIPLETIVFCNYRLLFNAISNLMRNAVKYSGGTKTTMRIIKEDDQFFTFSFRDDGQGVGEQHISHLFERFYRTEEGRERKSGGAGLGLPIVKSTFQSIGGEIIVRNSKEGGLEFIFTIPKGDIKKIKKQNNP